MYLALISPSARAPTEDVVELVKTYVETQHPVGAKPVINAAEAIEVTINGVIQLQEAASIEAIRAQAQEAVTAYLAEIALEGRGETSLNYYRIGMLIGAIEGVKEIVGYTVNSGEESLSASYNQFFSLKGLTLNASG